jgi:hypothetical protein
MNNKKKWKTPDKIGVALFALFFIFGLYLHFKEKDETFYIKQEYGKTIGKFYRYDAVGGTGTPYITYSYIVAGIKYFDQVGGGINYNYDFCYKNNNCRDKRFWVIYSIKDPSKSLINLTVELQDMENPPFPETLDNFK